MNYFSPSTGRTLTSGEFSALLGKVPTTQQLRELGYYPLVNPYSDSALVGELLVDTGNAQVGETYSVTYSVNPDLLDRLRSVIYYERGLVGKVSLFARETAPQGFLVCDGTVLNAEDYPALFQAIGGVFGGDGVATFAVPDLRGQFIRGWDEAGGTAAGVDPGRVFGSTQADELAAHDHYIPTNDASAAGSFTVADLANQTLDYTNLSATSSTGGTETRPTNVALLPCIYSGVFT